MKPHPLSLIEKRIGCSSLAGLGDEEFDFLCETLSKNSEVALSFEDPLLAMLHIYKKQLKEGKVGDEMERFIASIIYKQPSEGRVSMPVKVEEKPTQTFFGRAFGRETLVVGEAPKSEALNAETIASKFPKELQGTVNLILKKLEELEKDEKKSRTVVEKYSKEIAQAHEREVFSLKEETIRKLLKAAILEKGSEVQRERVGKISEEMLEPEDGKIKRTLDGEKERVKLLKEGITPVHSQLAKADLSLLPEGANLEKIKELKGLSIYSVTNPLSEGFVDAYSLLLRSFPRDELDPPKSLMEFLAATSKGVVEKNPKQKNEYMRFALFEVKDSTGEFSGEKGKTIAVAAGTFSAGEKTNTFYFSYIAVLPEYRRNHIATLLQTAMLTAGDDYAKDAEKRLGVSYQPKDGHKIMYAVGETEFPSLRPSEISDTWGRLMFNGVKGSYIIPPKYVRYLQPDVTVEEGMEYKREKWNPVPLGVMVRGVGGREVTEDAAIESLNLMVNGFIMSGMCRQGIEDDLKYAMANLKDTSSVKLVRLPQNVEEMASFIKEVGDSDSIMHQYYSSIPWAQKYLASAEKPVSIEEAIEIYERGPKQAPRDI